MFDERLKEYTLELRRKYGSNKVMEVAGIPHNSVTYWENRGGGVNMTTFTCYMRALSKFVDEEEKSKLKDLLLVTMFDE